MCINTSYQNKILSKYNFTIEKLYFSITVLIIMKIPPRMGSHKFRGKRSNVVRSLQLAETGESVYATVVKEMGKCMFLVDCSDSIRRTCLLRGKLQKKVWVGVSDTILVILRDDQPKGGYIDMKYTPAEVKVLKDSGYIKEFTEENAGFEVDFGNL